MDFNDMAKTLILGALGTVVSILTAQVMKRLQQALRKKAD